MVLLYVAKIRFKPSSFQKSHCWFLLWFSIWSSNNWGREEGLRIFFKRVLFSFPWLFPFLFFSLSWFVLWVETLVDIPILLFEGHHHTESLILRYHRKEHIPQEFVDRKNIRESLGWRVVDKYQINFVWLPLWGISYVMVQLQVAHLAAKCQGIVGNSFSLYIKYLLFTHVNI